MVQMIEDRPSVDEFPWTPQMVEAIGKVGILATPADEGLIEAIDSQQIFAPDPEIASQNTALLCAAAYKRVW